MAEALAAPVGGASGSPPMTRRNVIIVFIGILLTLLMSALDQTVVATAVWPIVQDLDPVNGLSAMSWVVIAYMLTSTATQPIYGKLSDLFGAKRVFLISVAVFLGGSFLCGAAQNMGQLIAFRAIQGIGAGGLYSVALVVIALMTSPRERAKFQGIGGAVVGISTVLGPLIGGFFTTDHSILGWHTSWRWLFYVNVPLGVVALAVVTTLLRLPAYRRAHRIDYLGALLILAAASCLLLGAEWGGDKYAWSSATIVGLLVGGVLLLALFVWRESVAAEPILPLRLFRNPTVSLASPVLFLVGFALMGSVVYVSMYLQIVYALTPTQSGLRLLGLTVGFMISAIGSGIVVSKIGRYKLFPILGSIFAGLGLGLLDTLDINSSIWLLIGYIFLIGLGVGLLMQLVVLVVQNAVPRPDLGAATTGATFFRTLGQSFGAALFGALLTNRIAASMPQLGGGAPSVAQMEQLDPQARHQYLSAFVDAAGTVFLVAGLVMVVSLVLCLLLPDITIVEVEEDALEM